MGNAQTLEILRQIARRNKEDARRVAEIFEVQADDVVKTFGSTGEVDAPNEWATKEEDVDFLIRVGMEYS